MALSLLFQLEIGMFKFLLILFFFFLFLTVILYCNIYTVIFAVLWFVQSFQLFLCIILAYPLVNLLLRAFCISFYIVFVIFCLTASNGHHHFSILQVHQTIKLIKYCY